MLLLPGQRVFDQKAEPAANCGSELRWLRRRIRSRCYPADRRQSDDKHESHVNLSIRQSCNARQSNIAALLVEASRVDLWEPGGQ